MPTSSSSAGTITGSISTIVTLLPRAAQYVANSHPIAPPPTTTTRAGIVSRSMASFDVITFLPSASSPGTKRVRPPVARITRLASRVRVPLPPGSATSTVVGLVNLAVPETCSTLFFLSK